MGLNQMLRNTHADTSFRTLPTLGPLEKSVDRILHRWPDAIREPDERDRDGLCREMSRRIENWDWREVPMMRVTSTAVAAFDETRCQRTEFEKLRAFLIRETQMSQSASFLGAMFWVYVGSFSPTARHTRALASALQAGRSLFGARLSGLIEAVPALLTPAEAPSVLARRMVDMDIPYVGLKQISFRAPHAPGLMQYVHRDFVKLLSDRLGTRAGVDQLFGWMMPTPAITLQSGAQEAIEAVLRPWVEKSPPKELQSYLSETIIENYRDPRTNHGGIWAGFDPKLKDVLLRWLTQEDMNFFCNVVTATQNSHMWPPRRDFWLSLFAQGRIDTAWVAFGGQARDYARQRLLRAGATNLASRFGRQVERNGDTSLLIMKFGNRIVVDGCHNYRTHIFHESEPDAPKLYQRDYHCDRIMRKSNRAKAHNSIPSWKAWVEQNI